MVRKRSEPVFETDETEAQLRSRSDARRERIQAEEDLLLLGETLVGMREGALLKLELPESLLSAIASARSVREGAAKNRALRLVRAGLRDVDVPALREVLEDRHGVTVGPAKLRKRDRPR